MKKKHNKIIIAGTGRSGTTFLIQLLTELGLDTGFDNPKDYLYKGKRAGLEYPIKFSGTIKDARLHFKHLPHILKSPYFSSLIKLFLDLDIIKVRHVIIPVRDLQEVAASRVDTGLVWLQTHDKTDIESQRVYSGYMLGSLIEACVLHDVPYTTIKFPQLAKDKAYCYSKLSRIFKSLDRKKFDKAFDKYSKPKQIKNTKPEVRVDESDVVEIVGL